MSPEMKQDASSWPDTLAKAIKTHNTLRSAEERGGDITKRSEFLREILQADLLAWSQANVPVQIALDVNGLKIDIGGKDRKNGIHSHLPYGFVEVAEIDGIIAASAMHENDVRELEILKARREGNAVEVEKLSRLQHAEVIDAMRDHSNEAYDRLDPDPDRFDFVLRGVTGTLTSTLEDRHRKPIHLTDEDLTKLLTPEFMGEEPEKCVMIAAMIAEATNRAGDDSYVDYQYDTHIGYRTHKFMRQSHRASKGTSRIFDRRQAALHGSRNYDTAKMLEQLFTMYPPEKLIKEMGVVMTRGAFKGGTEFIGMQYGNWYSRFLVHPEKHLSDEVRAAIHEHVDIPLLSREDYEFYESLLLPFRAFNSLLTTLKIYLEQPIQGPEPGKIYDHTRQHTYDAIRGIQTIMETEFDEPAFTEVFRAMQPVKKDVRASRIPRQEDVENLFSVLEKHAAEYRSRFEKKSALQVTQERLAPIEEHPQQYDEGFLAKFAKNIRDIVAAKSGTTIFKHGYKSTVYETGEKGLSYAHERKILSAMGLKETSVFTVVGGARFLNTEGPSGAFARSVTQALFRAAERTGAHILGPETAVGLGRILAEESQSRLQNAPEGEKEKVPHVFGIGPGRELVYEGNPILDTSDSASVNLAAPVDILASPYRAGYATHGTQSEQQRHNRYRQAIVKRLSYDHISPVVVVDGGSWTILECTAAIEDGQPIYPVEGSGRFADLLVHLKRNVSSWEKVKYEDTELTETVRALIETIPDEASRAVIRDEFNGRSHYRDELVEFLQTADIDLVQPQTVDTLEDTLVTLHEVNEKEKAERRRFYGASYEA